MSAFMLEPTIPPITDPLGKHWVQPDRGNINFRAGNAWMTIATFKQLAEYSATNPSGAYEGKMWRRHDGVYDEAYLKSGGKPEWLLAWFGESKIGPGYVSNNYAPIKLLDGLIDHQGVSS